MNRQKWIILVVLFLLLAGTVGVLGRLRSSHKLGAPGIKHTPIPGDVRVTMHLPERVLDYVSEPIDTPKDVVEGLPPDTSYTTRQYTAPDGFWCVVNIVLMGTDRTSLHKPQLCLVGQGWQIDNTVSREEKIRIERPQPYDMPVMKLISTAREFGEGRNRSAYKRIYAYWFVSENAVTAQHWQRMWWMAKDLLAAGVLERWAYVSCTAVCAPGQEDATFERMKRMIAASVPEFQTVSGPAAAPAHAAATGR